MLRMTLHKASIKGDVAEMRALVTKGADVNARDADGDAALHVAAYNGHVEAIKALVQLGADKDAKNDVGATPLHYAFAHGYIAAIKLLVQLGADKDAKNYDGCTPCEVLIRIDHPMANGKAGFSFHQAAEALQSKVRGVELAPVCGVSDAVFLAHGCVVSSEVPAAAFLWCRLFTHWLVCSGGWGAAEGQAAEGQGEDQRR
jgi:ankyrin repeat protein